MFPSSAVKEAVTDKMAGAQIRYDGHTTEKKKDKQKKKEQLTRCFMLSKVRKTYQTETSARRKIKWKMQAEAGKIGVKVALDGGRFDDRGIYSSSSSPSPPLPAFLF